MGWASKAKKATGPAGGSDAGLFVKLRDGDSIDFVLLGEPSARYMHWLEGENRPHDCVVNCEHCRAGVKVKTELMTTVYDVTESTERVFSLNTYYMRDLLELVEEYGEAMVYRCKRKHGKPVTYRFDRLQKVDEVDELRDRLRQAEPKDLTQWGGQDIDHGAPGLRQALRPPPSDDVPF